MSTAIESTLHRDTTTESWAYSNEKQQESSEEAIGAPEEDPLEFYDDKDVFVDIPSLLT